MGDRASRVATPEMHLRQVRELAAPFPGNVTISKQHVDSRDVGRLARVVGHPREILIVNPSAGAVIVAPGTVRGVIVKNVAHEQAAGFKAVGG